MLVWDLPQLSSSKMPEQDAALMWQSCFYWGTELEEYNGTDDLGSLVTVLSHLTCVENSMFLNLNCCQHPNLGRTRGALGVWRHASPAECAQPSTALGLLFCSPTQVWGQSQHRSVLPVPLFNCSVHYIVCLEVPLRCAVEQILYFVIDQQQGKPCFSEPSKAFVSLCSSVLVLSTLCVKHWEKC